MSKSPMIVTHVPLPDSQKVKGQKSKMASPAKPKRSKVPANVAAAVAEYQRLYKKKYSVAAEVTWDKPWVRIGTSNGVSLNRLRQLIQQLQY